MANSRRFERSLPIIRQFSKLYHLQIASSKSNDRKLLYIVFEPMIHVCKLGHLLPPVNRSVDTRPLTRRLNHPPSAPNFPPNEGYGFLYMITRHGAIFLPIILRSSYIDPIYILLIALPSHLASPIDLKITPSAVLAPFVSNLMLWSFRWGQRPSSFRSRHRKPYSLLPNG